MKRLSRFPNVRTLMVIAIVFAMPMMVSAQAADEVHTLDHEYLDIDRAIPGFGGLFHDQEGQANVWVTPSADRTRIRSVAEGEVNFLPADFTWSQLFDYKSQLVDVMTEPGVVFLDIDERTNRIHIGIAGERNAADRDARRTSIAARFGVPAKAIVVSETQPVVPELTLRNSIRPVPGGVEISFFRSLGRLVCTAGFIVRQNNSDYLITNSHCSRLQGGTENTAYRQPSGFIMGREHKDPGYSILLNGCPLGRICRHSDSAMVRFVRGNDGQRGRIAKPTCANCDELEIAGSGGSARFRVTEQGSVSVGTVLHKVGRTTGWTSGSKARSCATVNVADSSITLLCQDRADYDSAGGDSGSAVFERLAGNNVRLVGIHWGSNGWHSPLSALKAELGAFDPKAP